MRISNFTQFRDHLKDELELIVSNCEPTAVTTKTNDFVVLTKAEYDSWKETHYLLSTQANRDALALAQEQADRGEYAPRKPKGGV